MRKKNDNRHPANQDSTNDPENVPVNLDYIKKLEIQTLILNKIISSKDTKGITMDNNDSIPD